MRTTSVGLQDERTPLHLAIKEGHVEIVQILIDGGANVDEISKGLDSKVSRGHQRLRLLFSNEYTILIKFIVSKVLLYSKGSLRHKDSM